MKSVEFGRSASHREAAEGCPGMCGMCPSCVFAPTPPASTRCLWKVSDEFKRRFVVELLLRCRSTRVLEGIHGVLSVATSGTLFTYARSRSPTSPRDYPRRAADRPPDQKPLGMDVNEICLCFNSSPEWQQSRYLCRLFTFCDCELLRMVANFTSVLLVRHKRGFLQFNVSRGSTNRIRYQDSEDPALMVVPGSSKSVSGVSKHRDFIGCLPVDLSKRVLGLLDERTLRCCLKVCQCWKRLAKETVEEIKFRVLFQSQIEAMMKKCTSINKVSPTYANIVEVPVPVKDDEKVDVGVQKVKPFEAAYAKIKTKTVPMEERNVYCGAYFSTVLLAKQDPHRVVDFRGGPLMATGSKDRVARLLHVASETKAVAALSGHLGSIRAVLLCEDRGLLMTAGCDGSIRCWSLQTDKCEMVLHGHSGTINCLDVHADRLVSGAKDCKVKVWCLQTGKDFEDFQFKHTDPIQCVRINASAVYSSCSRGLVRVWDMENASLLREINAHENSVKCLFVDDRHFLSGDSGGRVMAWSASCDAEECLMTFNHPKEVKSLTLVYLRVITGCVDGKIRIFNFLTGDCLRDIPAEAQAGQILSLHFHDERILVNARSGVKLYQFAKVFWDYTEPPEGIRVGSAPERPLRKLPVVSEPLHRTRFLSAPTACGAQARERRDTPKPSLMLSEKATSERTKRRGLHRPLTRDAILLRVNAVQKAQCMDEAAVNMECNAGLRDSWGPRSARDPLQRRNRQARTWSAHDVHPPRAETCVPILKRAGGQNVTRMCTAPGAVKTGISLPRISLVGPLRVGGGLTVTQLEDCRVKRDLARGREHKLSERNKKPEKTS
ncbi:F-box/WD repeat-containing protein 10 [Cyclopterus lumpus]|uniref:F-box/WD repeat-containing protein 10 n=1 Tax=Cyclopterus lumpus TaxID=8103 RepID=UPI0014875B4D|nr:F-box/WD repeat-containing protein 10 [Cyclopterus lumpus]